jgi:hypothetical protein
MTIIAILTFYGKLTALRSLWVLPVILVAWNVAYWVAFSTVLTFTPTSGAPDANQCFVVINDESLYYNRVPPGGRCCDRS